MNDLLKDDASVARAGWHALLRLLVTKGVVTETEAQAVIMKAYADSAMRRRLAEIEAASASRSA